MQQPTDYNDSNNVICARLSLERCQKYLAHLHALMYMCDPVDLGMDEIMSESAKRIMAAMNQELLLSAKSLAGEAARSNVISINMQK